MNTIFNELVKTYAEKTIEFPRLKEITLAQWILESGRGTSRLAIDHLNFGVLKWRKEMAEFATPVDYKASDGWDKYCKFESLEKFIEGYWHFLDRFPYKGWRNNVESGKDFIHFIGSIYTTDKQYVFKVLDLLAEAKQHLERLTQEHHHPGTSEPISKPRIKEFIQSPNSSSRAGAGIDKIVVHYTTTATVESTINWFLKPESQVSAHYIIDKNGDIYQMVKDSDKAWHASHENLTSIGIEHVAKEGDRLTEAQEKSSIHLIKWLITEYKIPKDNIKAHKEISSTSCPGNIFGDHIDDISLPKFKAWVAKHFFNKITETPQQMGLSRVEIYIVQPGDNLCAIANHYGMTLDQLLEVNPSIQNPDLIFPSQKITVARVR